MQMWQDLSESLHLNLVSVGDQNRKHFPLARHRPAP